MKKVVIDGRESGTSTGRYVDKLVEYLNKLQPDLDITVLTKTPRIDYLKSVAPSFDVKESDFKEFTFAEQLGFWRQIKSTRADLVHFPMVQQPVLYKGDVVSGIADLTTARFRNPTKNWLVFSLKQQIYKWLIKRVAKKSKKIITISEFVKHDVAQYTKVPESKIVVAYPAADKIDQASEPVHDLAGKQFLLYVGRPNPHKNLDLLADAFEIIQQKYPDLSLVFAGKKDDLYQLLEDNIKNKKIKNVLLTGFVSDGQLKWLYENTSAYVFPSLSEGFGLPGLEAMVEGAPVVSSNATCLPEIYGKAAHYFNPTDVSDIAAKITDVLENPQLRKKLIEAGKAQVAKFSWERMAQQTLEVYKEVLN